MNVFMIRYFPEGIDVYFEHVGGEMLEAVLQNMRVHGRIAGCGMISEYDRQAEPRGARNLLEIIVRRLHFIGFTHRDYDHVYPNFLEFVLPYIRQGKIVFVEDIADGLDKGPAALAAVFTGRNFGKQVVKVASE